MNKNDDMMEIEIPIKRKKTKHKVFKLIIKDEFGNSVQIKKGKIVTKGLKLLLPLQIEIATGSGDLFLFNIKSQ